MTFQGIRYPYCTLADMDKSRKIPNLDNINLCNISKLSLGESLVENIKQKGT